jgi:hypothetical protein
MVAVSRRTVSMTSMLERFWPKGRTAAADRRASISARPRSTSSASTSVVGEVGLEPTKA